MNDKKINPSLQKTCPVTGKALKITPGSPIQTVDGKWSCDIAQIDDFIFIDHAKGFSTGESSILYEKFLEKTVAAMPSHKKFVIVDDLEESNGINAEGKKILINTYIKQKKMAAIIYINAPTLLKFSILISKGLRFFNFRIEIASSYEEAILLAHKILGIPCSLLNENKNDNKNNQNVDNEAQTRESKEPCYEECSLNNKNKSITYDELNHEFESLIKSLMSINWSSKNPSFDIPYQTRRKDLPFEILYELLSTIQLEIENLLQNRDESAFKMVQMSKMSSIGEIASHVIHEINNPLTIIAGLSDIIKTKLKSEEEISREEILPLLEKISLSLSRISNIIVSMKKFIHTGGVDAESGEKVNVHDVILSLVDMMNIVYEKNQIKLLVSTKAEHFYVSGNSGRLQQVLMNLLSNAFDSFVLNEKNSSRNLGKEKFVEISTSNRLDEDSSREELIIEVKDNGWGIKDEDKQKLFKNYFTTKPKGKGTGLGLRICLEIIESMGGYLSFDSKWGEGTSFYLCLPRLKE